jgi:predicted nucleotidyltransferase component of viral defense system
MLNKEKHRLLMGRILRDIYSDISISSLLGFKGGTCAYFFYGLPRFSVDLDFDLLEPDEDKKEIVFKQIEGIISKYGEIKDKRVKRNTIFFLLSYGESEHNIKLEINTRTFKDVKNHYKIRDHLGISMLVARKEYLFSAKLTALTSREVTATRDIYDIYYFAKNNWDINTDFIKERTGKNIKQHLNDCIALVERIDNKQIMQGLGELVSEKEKDWIKENLKQETIFMLENYKQALN